MEKERGRKNKDRFRNYDIKNFKNPKSKTTNHIN